MDRRKFIRTLTAAGGSAVLLPQLLAACGSDDSGAAAPATTAAAAGGTAGAAATTSPESAASGARKKIAFSHPFSTAPVAIAVMQFAKQRANELGYDLLLDNANNQVETQVTDLDTWVTQGVDAICVLPVEPQSVLGTQKRAQEAGIKWTTYAVTMDGSDGQVLFPHELSGKVIGEAAVAWINAQPSPPKILVLTSSKTPASAARTSVPLDLVKAQTKGDVVAQQDAVDQPSGLSVTETVLQAHPDLRCVIGFNDDGALGALQAFKNAGIPVDESWIGGQDGSIEALEAIKSGGYFKACAALPLKDIGYAVADINDQLLKGTSKFAEVSIDPVLASPDQMATVDELIAAYPK